MTTTDAEDKLETLSPAMRAAILSARYDRGLQTVTRRTARALRDRGLVTVRYGRGTDHRGNTVHDAVVGVDLTDDGVAVRDALRADEAADRCVCGALDFGACLCGITPSQFLATPSRLPRRV